MTDPQSAPGRHGQRKDRRRRAFWRRLGGNAPALEDAGLAAALATARNTWLAEYCAEDPKRIKGTAALAQQDIDASVIELRRCVKELGMVGASIFPNVKGRHLGDPYYFPLYAEAEKLNVPICVAYVSRPLRLRCHGNRTGRQVFLFAPVRPSL